ncbi:PREDICTED: shematrin-like protein 1 [Ceratosolen solmsi marchali]|uniref:Shematrin-like protein 1 n=1 Tax=Ceratosolen solmsi marchali TaxID=326594 RepID=A0AAJ6YTI4_9HYME|nr:PREDICTED: shematrin-like protein 1 [Ceratosolen solmsi marchali]
MFKLFVVLISVAYAAAGGLYSSYDSYNYGNSYGNNYGYGYGLGGYDLRHNGAIVNYAPYANSYANIYETSYPVIYPNYYSAVKKIHYTNPLYKLGHYLPTYLGSYAASYSPYNSYSYGINNYNYALSHDYGGYGGYSGISSVSTSGHNIFHRY